ncbi:MAG: hypothetical protein HRU14_10025 [Planctomycetes bacterium]|nr:hypothetical protein [Planctomycetota bacterium]
MARLGTRLPEGTPPDPALFTADLGEDWVVPRSAVRYLVVQQTAEGAVMTAYGPHGSIVGDRYASSLDALTALLTSAAQRGVAETPRIIPDDAPSALAWLDGRNC